MGWIYKITCKETGKCYIGKTEYNNPWKRWKEHCNDYKRRRCEKRPLYYAMNKYGVGKFEFELIEQINDSAKLCEKESYWINEFRTYVGFDDCNGYNATLGGDGKSYLNLNENEVVCKYNEFNGNKEQTARFFKVDSNTISEILKSNNIHINTMQETIKNITGIQINQIDINTHKIINTFRCIADANRYFGKDRLNGNIRNALNYRGKTAYGFYWERA